MQFFLLLLILAKPWVERQEKATKMRDKSSFSNLCPCADFCTLHNLTDLSMKKCTFCGWLILISFDWLIKPKFLDSFIPDSVRQFPYLWDGPSINQSKSGAVSTFWERFDILFGCFLLCVSIIFLRTFIFSCVSVGWCARVGFLYAEQRSI